MKRLRLSVVVWCLLLAVYPGVAFAQYSSPNYSSNEVFFGSGGDTGQSSSSYQAQVSVGSLGVGNASSTNYQAYSGFLTPNVPFLQLVVNTSTVNLGNLSTTAANTGTATFDVRAYVDSGYTVQTISNPPTATGPYNSHTLSAMTSLGSSSTGIEQFGINLVANTSPATFGANPVPEPSSSFANGEAASGYNTANQYQYNVGNTIAQSATNGWGDTTYTISYLANISAVTPAGNYSVVQNLVAVATY